MSSKKRLPLYLTLMCLAVALPFLIAQASQSGGQTAADLARTTAMETSADAELLTADNKIDYSHRLVVELNSAPVAEAITARSANGRLQLNTPMVQTYIAQLEAEQAEFRTAMRQTLPSANVAGFINETGLREEATYTLAFNGMTIDAGKDADLDALKAQLAALPNVKAVHHDYAYYPETYSSMELINAPAAWNMVGGQDNAGEGIRVASMDGGVHHEGSQFSGEGFEYPPGYPLGDTANTNGKIIVSRAYFREFDPPADGDENTWPGENGTSHGVHTAATAAGNAVTDTYGGLPVEVTGVAPAAYVMSYRVFYASMQDDGSFHLAEGIAALEDIVADGAHVVNNSWGGGPGSAGGENDPLDAALINASEAGVFVSMSAGNSGPGEGTTDHPSDDYINVAASTTDSSYASGRLSVTAPEPVTDTLTGPLPFASASFGAGLDFGQVYTYEYVTSTSVDAANFEGCNPWPAGSFDGVAAVISRGACEFGVKVLNAENAGAEMVVIYNHASGGEDLINMGGGAVGGQVTIPSIFVGHTNGLNMVAWHADNPTTAELTLDMNPYLVDGQGADYIANFSSRGPGVGNVLKPDIAAPGVNIMAQGYVPGAGGEDRHLKIGQASGTSMAAPHVAGAAAVLRQMYPTWTNAQIKSALMSTSKYMEVYNGDGSPAQPLDMGAGRIDLAAATDPGIILDPPSLSYGYVVTGTNSTIEVDVTNITTATETYTVSTAYTGGGFDSVTALPGFSSSAASVTLAPGETKTVEVTFDSMESMGMGDNQGYILMHGDNGHMAHMPAWARVVEATTDKVLVLDVDYSNILSLTDYQAYYTEALQNLGHDYDVIEASCCASATIPAVEALNEYRAIVLFTGDHYQPDGTFTNGGVPVSTALTDIDENILTQYANNGGIIIAMGQDLAAVLGSDSTDNGSFFYSSILGGNWLNDSVTGFMAPREPIRGHEDAPPALQGAYIDVSVNNNSNTIDLVGANQVPAVSSPNQATAELSAYSYSNTLEYNVTVMAAEPMTITAAHIHTGTVGTNGGVVVSLGITQSVYITDSYTFGGSVEFPQMAPDDNYYINIHTQQHPGGELRGQLDLMGAYNSDGAGNQYYIDRLEEPSRSPSNMIDNSQRAVPLLTYGTHSFNVVAIGHRDQKTLEHPQTNYYGRSIYTSFGLEGVNTTEAGGRPEALGSFLNWAMDEATVTMTVDSYVDTSEITRFMAHGSSTSGADMVSFRWNMGDGSEIIETTEPYVGHQYNYCGMHMVHVEATNAWGNTDVYSMPVMVDNCTDGYPIFLPMINR